MVCCHHTTVCTKPARVTLFETTPEDLLTDGIYTTLAIPYYSEPYRQISLALAARALGAHAEQPSFLLQKTAREAMHTIAETVRLSRPSRRGHRELSMSENTSHSNSHGHAHAHADTHAHAHAHAHAHPAAQKRETVRETMLEPTRESPNGEDRQAPPENPAGSTVSSSQVSAPPYVQPSSRSSLRCSIASLSNYKILNLRTRSAMSRLGFVKTKPDDDPAPAATVGGKKRSNTLG
eukprot:3975804-Pleurochrysis_carterae.AAC.3